jgi:hypothetical protein
MVVRAEARGSVQHDPNPGRKSGAERLPRGLSRHWRGGFELVKHDPNPKRQRGAWLVVRDTMVSRIAARLRRGITHGGLATMFPTDSPRPRRGGEVPRQCL